MAAAADIVVRVEYSEEEADLVARALFELQLHSFGEPQMRAEAGRLEAQLVQARQEAS